MRLLEITFLVLTFVLLIWSLKRNSAKSVAFFIISGCTFLILILHLIIEGWRAQMFPAYVVGVIILAVAAKRKVINRDLTIPPRSKFRLILKILLSSAGIILLFVSGFLSWALPVFQLPAPTGPYQVGTSQWYLMDKSREETHTDQSDDYREIPVYGWYPADASNLKETAEYMNPGLFVKAVRSLVKTGPKWLNELAGVLLFDQLRLVRTHAYSDATVLKKQSPYPVLIFSHGYASVATQNTVLMEELASHGYAVFSIGHTYESIVESFPDGRIVTFSPRFDAPASVSKLEKEAEKIKSGDLAESIALFKKYHTSQSYGGSIDVWSADTRFVIDWLEKLNNEEQTNPFYQQLDLNRLGVFGMSFGGATASQIVFEDPRVKAAVNLDGGLPVSEFIDKSLDTPFMFMNSEFTSALQFVNQKLREYMMARANIDVYNITVSGSIHEDFTEFPLLFPLFRKTIGPPESIDSQKMLKIMNAYTLAFFNKYLKGIDSPLLDGPSPDFPEVIIKTGNQ